MKKIVKVLSVLFMAIMVLMIFTACSSKKDSDKTGSKDETKTKEESTTKEEGTTKEESKNNIKVGDIYTFGAYEQDNDTSNGKEAIEWIVVDKDGASICLISKYALDGQPYNTSKADVTWETCSLREWLNNTFINDAFSAEEQAMIVTTTVTADKNPTFDTDPGNNTQDKVFLLSITETDKYFSSDDERMCAITDYADARGVHTSDSYSTDDGAACTWWLRSPGGSGNFAAGVTNDGSVSTYGINVSFNDEGVRPALWITPKS